MLYALVDETTGAFVSGPFSTAPAPGAGQIVAEYVTLTTTILSKLAFQRRFTLTERIDIRNSLDPIVVDYRELGTLAAEIDLLDADVIAGVGYLETSGLIGTGRAAEILTV